MIHLIITIPVSWDFPGGTVGKESTCQCQSCKQSGFDPWDEKIPWSRKQQPLQHSCLENSTARGAWQGNSPWSPKCWPWPSTHTCIPVNYISTIKCQIIKKHEVFKEPWILSGLSICGLPLCGLPWWLSWQRIHLQCGRPGFDPWVGKIPRRRERLPIPAFWPGESHELYSPWGCKE